MPPYPQTVLPLRKKPYDRPQASAAGTSSGAPERKDKKRDKKEKKRAKEAMAAGPSATSTSTVYISSGGSTAKTAMVTPPGEKRKRDKKKNKACTGATPPGGDTGPGTKPSGSSLSEPHFLKSETVPSSSPRRAYKHIAHAHPHAPLAPATADLNVKSSPAPAPCVSAFVASEKDVHLAKHRANTVQWELRRAREEARKLEVVRQQLAQAQEEVQMLRNATEKANSREEGLKKKLKDMVVKAEVAELAKKTQESAIHAHESTRRDLKEALTCGVCFEIYSDPHILSCGHLACRDCLSQWFRTPGAYVTAPLDPITPETDLSHRSKTCHLCRAVILRRPARAFFLRNILEPLGFQPSGDDTNATQSLDENDPGASAVPDPWRLLFPVEPETYKIWDERDAVHRCPTCADEIEDGLCYQCAYEFSEEENSDDEEGLFDVFESDDEDDGEDEGELDALPRIYAGAGAGQGEHLPRNILPDALSDDVLGMYPQGLNAVMGVLLAGMDDQVDDESPDDDDASHGRYGSDDPLDSEWGGSLDEYGGSFIDDSPRPSEDEEYDEDYQDSEDEGEGHRGGLPPRYVSHQALFLTRQTTTLPRVRATADIASQPASATPPPNLIPPLSPPRGEWHRRDAVDNAGVTSESEVDAGAVSASGSGRGSGSAADRYEDTEDDGEPDANDAQVIVGPRLRRRGRVVVLSDEDED